MKKIYWLIISLLLILPINTKALERIDLYLFHSSTCEHCQAEIKYLDSIKDKYPNLKVHLYETTDPTEESTKNAKIGMNVASKLGVTYQTPFTILGETYYIGFSENIEKSFGSLQVLRGISLNINKGEVVSIVGPSGAGKTTLLQIMGTLDTPNAGKVIINGMNVLHFKEKELSAFRNQHIGFVFQFHQLLPEFTAIENVMIPALIAGKNKLDAHQEALGLLSFMGLQNRSDHKPNELSGGEKQRVAVARALVNHPDVVLADEPSGSLDSLNKTELHQLFFELRNRLNQTFVIVTHDESLAKMTDRTIHLKDGMIIQA